jgi:cytochrome P450
VFRADILLQPATLLAGIVYYLVTNPIVYNQAVTEVRTGFKNDEDITSAELARLEYLNAVIRETMRIFPVAGDVLPRLIPKGGDTILGDWLPEGVSDRTVSKYKIC